MGGDPKMYQGIAVVACPYCNYDNEFVPDNVMLDGSSEDQFKCDSCKKGFEIFDTEKRHD